MNEKRHERKKKIVEKAMNLCSGDITALMMEIKGIQG